MLSLNYMDGTALHCGIGSKNGNIAIVDWLTSVLSNSKNDKDEIKDEEEEEEQEDEEQEQEEEEKEEEE